MGQPLEETSEALDRLVQQFADPLSFFRELIQNSIDAGTPQIDIFFDYRDGLMNLHVDDYGEGMDRQIIDTRLTRLFSSGKEGDYTKIGRFGIGFVSIFALEPDAVVVDTARGGESWRLLFRADRSFERIALELPVDGTKVRIVKEMSHEDYEELRRRAPEVISYWCRHVEPEIRVDGRKINEILDIESLCSLRYEEEGTEIVVAYQGTGRGTQVCGYYNRGITLHEEQGPGPICFKIDSRYLEHTLTRDNVLRDENYDKAMSKVHELMDQVSRQLFERFEAMICAEEPSPDSETVGQLVARQLQAWRIDGEVDRLKAFGHYRILLCHGGSTLSGDGFRRALQEGRLWTADSPSPAVQAMVERGDTVVVAGRSDAAAQILRALEQPAPVAADSVFFVPKPLSEPLPGTPELTGAVERLLISHGAKVSAVELASLGYPRSPVADRVAVTQSVYGQLTRVEEAERLGDGFLDRRRVIVLNADHDTVQALLRLAPQEASLAAFMAVKLLYLRSELTPELDSRLAGLALEQR